MAGPVIFGLLGMVFGFLSYFWTQGKDDSLIFGKVKVALGVVAVAFWGIAVWLLVSQK